MGMKKGQKKKEGRKGEGRTKARQVVEKFGKWLFRGSRRTTEKDGGSDEEAAGSAGQRIQMDGGLSKRWKQPEKTEVKLRKKHVYLGAFCSMDRLGVQRKYMRRYKGQCDIFFWDRAQIEEGGNGAAQESPMKGQAVRMEIIHREESLSQSTAI